MYDLPFPPLTEPLTQRNSPQASLADQNGPLQSSFVSWKTIIQIAFKHNSMTLIRMSMLESFAHSSHTYMTPIPIGDLAPRTDVGRKITISRQAAKLKDLVLDASEQVNYLVSP